MQHKNRIALTGGGSGGHMYPLLTIAKQLQTLAIEQGTIIDIRYFGDAMEYGLLLENAKIRIVHIAVSKLRRYFSWRVPIDGIQFIIGILQGLWKIFWFMPDVVYSKGGPGALAVLIACRFYRIPIIIHDSDAIPGLTSRITGKFARIIQVGFLSAKKYFEHDERVHVTGNPVRVDIVQGTSNITPSLMSGAKERLGFMSNEPLLFIQGGSLGALAINNFVLGNLPLLLKRYQVLHQVGVNNIEAYTKKYEALKNTMPESQRARYRAVAFLQNDLLDALIAADLIISRAGAGSIAEIATAGKPSILIPLPESASDHQKENAYQYKDVGACTIIDQENLIGALVVQQIDSILNDEVGLQNMKKSAKQFSSPQAAEIIVKDILDLLPNKLLTNFS